MQQCILLQGKPTEGSSSLTVKDYGQLDAADIVPGTEVRTHAHTCVRA